MPKSLPYIVTLEKDYHKSPDYPVVKQHMDRMLKVAVGNARLRKQWQVVLFSAPKAVQDAGVYTVTRKVNFQKIAGQKRTEEKDWATIYAKLERTAASKGWRVLCDNKPKLSAKAKPAPVVIVQPDQKDYAPINLEMGNRFDHIFGLDAQIRRVMRALKLAKLTNMQERQHQLLFGLPGCGKTELLRAIGPMLGEEKKHYIEFAATSTTQAGAISVFLNSPYIPPVLLVEEIEKTNKNDLRWLLGLLDQRAEIRQTNFRVGNRARNVKVVCIATCNDLDLLKGIESGALYSRFAKIYCPRPNEENLRRILEGKVNKLPHGKLEWIEPAMQFAKEMQMDDPREIIEFLLSGQEDLMNGRAQEDYRATMEPGSIPPQRNVYPRP